MAKLKLTPGEYCARWVPIIYGIEPDERGYRSKCVVELNHATGFALTTIEGWGSDLNNVSSRSREQVEMMLAMRDAMNKSDLAIHPFMKRLHNR